MFSIAMTSSYSISVRTMWSGSSVSSWSDINWCRNGLETIIALFFKFYHSSFRRYLDNRRIDLWHFILFLELGTCMRTSLKEPLWNKKFSFRQSMTISNSPFSIQMSKPQGHVLCTQGFLLSKACLYFSQICCWWI